MAVAVYPILMGIQSHIMRNLPEYLTFVGAVAIASVVTMPRAIPRSIDDLWTWMRDALQTAVPAARNHQNPNQPEGPANQK